MNNQRRAVYSERRRVLDGRALKNQVIGYGERTMGEIVEAYVNPDLPPEEWDLGQLVGKVKEFIYLLEDLTLISCRALAWSSRLSFEQLRNAYDLKEGQIEQQRPGLMGRPSVSSSFSRLTPGVSIFRLWMLFANPLAYAATVRKTLSLNTKMKAMTCSLR